MSFFYFSFFFSRYLRGVALRTAVNHGDVGAIKKGKELFNQWKNVASKRYSNVFIYHVYLSLLHFSTFLPFE